MNRLNGVQRAALYCRVSTEEQEKHGLSLDSQKEVLERYAKDNGLKIVGTFIDGGVSARKKYKTRPAFMEMLSLVEQEQIDVILFIKLDRWFRNIADYYEVQSILDRHHVQWIATEEEYDTTTANGRLHLNIKLSIAQDEADRTSERIKFVFQGKRERGELLSGSVPYGFRIEEKKMVIVPEEAEIVKGAFNYYISVRSITKVVEYLHAHGKSISWRGAGFLLENKRYIDTIVDRNTWELAQEIRATRAQRTTRTGRVYIFGGLVYCGECGHVMMSCYTKGLKYYRCRNYVLNKTCGNYKNISQNTLEKWLLLNLEKECADYNLSIKAKPKKVKKINRQAVQKKMDKLTDLYLNDLVTREKYETDYKALQASLSEEASTDKEIDLSALKTVIDAYNVLNDEEKKGFWSRVLKKIIAHPDGSFSFVPRSI